MTRKCANYWNNTCHGARDWTSYGHVICAWSGKHFGKICWKWISVARVTVLKLWKHTFWARAVREFRNFEQRFQMRWFDGLQRRLLESGATDFRNFFTSMLTDTTAMDRQHREIHIVQQFSMFGCTPCCSQTAVIITLPGQHLCIIGFWQIYARKLAQRVEMNGC